VTQFGSWRGPPGRSPCGTYSVVALSDASDLQATRSPAPVLPQLQPSRNHLPGL
jgi:hypothetical protein